jgi:hypothetical protein
MKIKMIQGEHYNLHGKCVFTRTNHTHEVDDKTGERLLSATVKRRDGEGHPTGTAPRFERVRDESPADDATAASSAPPPARPRSGGRAQSTADA